MCATASGSRLPRPKFRIAFNTMLTPELVRPHFPALKRMHNGRPLVYFDGPGGTQVTQACIDGYVKYFSTCNANNHGAFITSHESDVVNDDGHLVMADFLNARSAEEIIWGQNMTSLTFALSRSLGRLLNPGDEIILTALDHDANFAPWKFMADERGVKVHVVEVNLMDCTLVVDDFEKYLGPRTRLVAVGGVSNAVGSINPIKQIIGMAKAAGALTFVDAVALAPHVAIDVQDWDTDFLGCSTYKFWGPHNGILYGKKEVLDTLPPYKVRPSDNALPGRFETGTQSVESMAGIIGTMEYLASLEPHVQEVPVTGAYRSDRARMLHRVMDAIQLYEQGFSAHLLEGLAAIKKVKVFGIADPNKLGQRVPTVALRVGGESPRATAERLAQHGICVWDGNYYAINLTERLGVEDTGGMVRVGLVHYNTHEEIDRLLNAL